jgi:hypothetical protein
LSLMGSLLFFLGGKNLVYLIWQSSFVKVSGIQFVKHNMVEKPIISPLT